MSGVRRDLLPVPWNTITPLWTPQRNSIQITLVESRTAGILATTHYARSATVLAPPSVLLIQFSILLDFLFTAVLMYSIMLLSLSNIAHSYSLAVLNSIGLWQALTTGRQTVGFVTVIRSRFPKPQFNSTSQHTMRNPRFLLEYLDFVTVSVSKKV